MRAINLIPEDAPGRGGGGNGVFVLLGVLAALLAGVAFYVLVSNSVVSRRAELASVQTQVAAAQARAEAVRPYRDFAALASARVETIRQLGASRFDWHRALADLSKVIPDDVWLSSLVGTVTTGVNVTGGSGGTTSSLRSALPNPAIQLTGCTVNHDSVVRLIAHLRLMRGVQRVSLADSTKDDGGGADCQHENKNFPQFDLVIFFAAPASPTAPATGAPSATPAAATTTPAPSAPTAPATTTPNAGAVTG